MEDCTAVLYETMSRIRNQHGHEQVRNGREGSGKEVSPPVINALFIHELNFLLWKTNESTPKKNKTKVLFIHPKTWEACTTVAKGKIPATPSTLAANRPLTPKTKQQWHKQEAHRAGSGELRQRSLSPAATATASFNLCFLSIC